MWIYRFKTGRVVHHIPRFGGVYEFTCRKAAEERRKELMDEGWEATQIVRVKV